MSADAKKQTSVQRFDPPGGRKPTFNPAQEIPPVPPFVEKETQSREYVPHGPIRADMLKPPQTPTITVKAEAPAANGAMTGNGRLVKAVASLAAAFTPATSGRQLSTGSDVANVRPEEEKVAHETSEALKMSLENIRGLITAECRALEALLHEKNNGYGNSALDPIRVFSKASPAEGLLVRIDDKLSRIARGDLTLVQDEKLPQTVDDLMGYLVLLKVAWRLGLK